ncbi:hypothetical protein [Pseudoxanthomonas wuyuanensis]|uniref:Uncharacterized protein n=1 Tax=Pseudoxanthomonas wuyuanensis TaxID=1073196 RepID=A0A286D9E5_9GAMM|nr:hypothetical protein [Pseudoxanthomonas wuyuanensis]SOD55286.1 hypothetical protein SAMN06296416_106256 [Pseudoxanthomonas wuyuanensis]
MSKPIKHHPEPSEPPQTAASGASPADTPRTPARVPAAAPMLARHPSAPRSRHLA